MINSRVRSHAITTDVSLVQTIADAQFNMCDGVVVTGSHTGSSVNSDEFASVMRMQDRPPVWIGSGLTATNVRQFSAATAFIVGSELKVDGKWANRLCAERMAQFCDACHRLSET